MILGNEAFQSEKSKNDDYLMECTDRAITELVHPRIAVLKAYNYYHGFRDAELFRYLEENYGLGNATSVKFTPLVKKHVDALIGEYIDIPIIPKISCKDKSTLSNILRDKQLAIKLGLYLFLQQLLNKLALAIMTLGKTQDMCVLEDIQKLLDSLSNNYISEYEIAALNIIQYIILNRDIDFLNKLQTMLLDILVAGMAFYKVGLSPSGDNIQIEVLNPLMTFTDYNPDATYRKDDYRNVVVRELTVSQILNRYGHLMEKNDIEKLKGELDLHITDGNVYYVRNYSCNPTGYPANNGLLANTEVIPGPPHTGRYYSWRSQYTIPVYEVEWLTTNKVGDRYVMDRYETVRIGGDAYILTGKSETAVRSTDSPDKCSLSVNGIYFQNRNSEPYSLMIATMDLQDQYDLLHFFRDNLIANSGTAGDWLDISQLPEELGSSTAERIIKWFAYKKAGAALINTAQEGRPYNVNTVYGGYDDTVKLNAILAILLAIESTENTCSSITGVFRERLNGIEAKDAVTNVAVGQRNSYTVTKKYYQLMDTLTRGILIDSLDMAKIAYKNGITGSIILGDNLLKIFTALPEYYTVTSFDIHIPTSTEIVRDAESIKSLALELIKGGLVSPDIIMEIVTSKSLTEMKTKVNDALKKQKAENDQLLKLAQQNKLMEQQLKEAEGLLKEALSQVDQFLQKKLSIEQEKSKNDNDRDWFRARKEAEYNNKLIEVKKEQLKLEGLLLLDNNNRNNKIKDVNGLNT